jgi:chorismate-pyruvate lyase
VRIELFVDDQVAVHARAVAAGATARSPVTEHEYATVGRRSLGRMLQRTASGATARSAEL